MEKINADIKKINEYIVLLIIVVTILSIIIYFLQYKKCPVVIIPKGAENDQLVHKMEDIEAETFNYDHSFPPKTYFPHGFRVSVKNLKICPEETNQLIQK